MLSKGDIVSTKRNPHKTAALFKALCIVQITELDPASYYYRSELDRGTCATVTTGPAQRQHTSKFNKQEMQRVFEYMRKSKIYKKTMVDFRIVGGYE